MMKYTNYFKIIIATTLLFGLFPTQRALAQGPTLGGCQIFPDDNIWNTPIDSLPVDPNSDAYITTIGPTLHPHADFGSGLWDDAPIGIPYAVVTSTQQMVPINFTAYGGESDPGPYPVPPNAPIEGGPDSDGDRHVLVLRQGECKLYEMFYSFPNGGGWDAASGAIFDLGSNALRTEGRTSADAAGLPILPGLVRYEEVVAGEIKHALRFTVPQTRDEYVWPARHYASNSSDPNRPPMGQYFRLKADFVIDNSFSPQGQVILQALKTYGMILADNGSAWYISGAPNDNWDNNALKNDFNRVSGSDFEAVDVSSLRVDPDSGQVKSADDFSVSASPNSQAIDPAETATFPVSVTASGNFSSSVTLVTASPSPDLTVSLSPAVLTPTAQVTLTITDTHPAGALLPGLWYTIPVTATGGGLTRTTTVDLLIGGSRVYLPVVLK